jgi:exopolysaccharide biosynthesis protein
VWCTIFLAIVVILGCGRQPDAFKAGSAGTPSELNIARGVTLRSFSNGSNPVSDVHLLEIDLASPGARLSVVADGVGLKAGRVYGDSFTVADLCRKRGAVAGINGGFFGLSDRNRKEFIGLLASKGSIVSSGRLVRPSGHREMRIARSVFGIDKMRTPHIGWAVGERGHAALLTEYLSPVNPTKQRYWNVESAVACGPRLIQAGRIAITDRDERLASPGLLRRTFVGYDSEKGRPRHMVLAIGDAMTFSDVTSCLQGYFKKYHGRSCAEAMALDGGASTQLAYRKADGTIDSVGSWMTVPTAIVVHAAVN